MKMLVKFFI